MNESSSGSKPYTQVPGMRPHLGAHASLSVEFGRMPGTVLWSIIWQYDQAWPAMRVISLGIRTVPVLSVAKKLAAPLPAPTASAAKCGLIRRDEAD